MLILADGVVDNFGVYWELPLLELCSVCGQPDNCGDCDHNPLSPDQVKLLKG